MFEIAKLDHEDDRVRRAIFDYLAPHEPRCLFIVGNLRSGFPGSHLYVARNGEQWLGIAGYYDRPKSIVPFCADPVVMRALVRYVAAVHSPIVWLNGVAAIVRPALDELLSLGYGLANTPEQLLMELPLPEGGEFRHWPLEDRVRPIAEGDAPRVARLIRCISRPDDLSPISDEEIGLVTMNRQRMVLELDGQIVATASTNGLGLRAFQILAVATDLAFRRRGCARAVCAALIHAMRERGARHCVLFTAAANDIAQRCYAGLGFRVTEDYVVAKLQ